MLASSLLGLLAALIPILVNNFYDFQVLLDRQLNLQKLRRDEYDFVLVGGGVAGAVLANRLSQHHHVLLIEAGGHPGPANVQSVPLFQPFLLQTDIDYNYETVEMQNMALAYIGQRRKVPRGKGLGGGSNINNMMYIRGHFQDYNEWGKITNSKIWAWENVLKFFKKSEDYHGNYDLGSQHATGNEVYVGRHHYKLPLQDILFYAFKEQNITIGDINVLSGRAFGYAEVTIKNGVRWGTYNSFIKPILGRRNLKIEAFAKGIKVHFSNDSPMRAVGVTYRQNNIDHYVKARYEVILSAGVVDTPKLLLLSGIGPTHHLKSMGIETLIDLPVGETLKVHFYTMIPFLVNETISFVPSRDYNTENLSKYYSQKKGVLTTSAARFGIGYSYTSCENDHTWPDMYYIFNGIAGGTLFVGQTIAGETGTLNTKVYETYLKPIANTDGFLLHTAFVKPKSIGFIKLKSKDPEDNPIINPGYADDSRDIGCIIDGIEYMVKLVESSKAFQRVGAHVSPILFPGCEHLKFKSRAYWECFIRHVSESPNDSYSGCRMGNGTAASKGTSVVDSQLRVLGVKNLRVIDMSVVPGVMTGNPQASAILIGEIGSHLILRHYKDRKSGEY